MACVIRCRRWHVARIKESGWHSNAYARAALRMGTAKTGAEHPSTPISNCVADNRTFPRRFARSIVEWETWGQGNFLLKPPKYCQRQHTAVLARAVVA